MVVRVMCLIHQPSWCIHCLCVCVCVCVACLWRCVSLWFGYCRCGSRYMYLLRNVPPSGDGGYMYLLRNLMGLSFKRWRLTSQRNIFGLPGTLRLHWRRRQVPVLHSRRQVHNNSCRRNADNDLFCLCHTWYRCYQKFPQIGRNCSPASYFFLVVTHPQDARLILQWGHAFSKNSSP